MLINAQEFYNHLKIAMNALGVRWGDMDQIAIQCAKGGITFIHKTGSFTIGIDQENTNDEG